MTKYKFTRLFTDHMGNPHTLPARNVDMIKKLGLHTTRLPDAGMEPQMVDGIKVWVTPRAEPMDRARGVRKSSTHRIMCECPKCGHHLSVGRLHQHSCDRRR